MKYCAVACRSDSYKTATVVPEPVKSTLAGGKRVLRGGVLWAASLTCEGRRLTTPLQRNSPVEMFYETESNIRSVCVLLANGAMAEADHGAS